MLAYATGQRLRHLVGTNEVFVTLATHARHHDDCELVEWLSEAECAKWTDNRLRPDGLGVWSEGGQPVEFFLEYDRGTESLSRLAAKLHDYEWFESERGVSTWVLFMFESERRELTARVALASATVPIATAAMMRPHDPVWMPLRTEERVTLAALADVPKPPEAVERAAKSEGRAWRYDRNRTPRD